MTDLRPLVVISLCLLLAEAASAARVERVVDLSARNARLEQTETGARWTWDGADHSGVAGDPAIGWTTLRVALRADEVIRGVRIEPIDVTRIDLADWLAPVGEVGRDGAPIETFAEPAHYAGHHAWPIDAGRSSDIGFAEGQRITSVAVAPMQYMPSRGEIEFYPRFRIVLDTETIARPDGVLRPLRRPGRASLERRAPRPLADWVVSDDRHEHRMIADPPDAGPATRRPSLEGGGIDFVIVTRSDMVSEFERLAEWRTKQGLRSTVRDIDWVIANYDGADLQERVRNFLRDAWVQWGTRYALLGADHSILPVRYAFSRHRQDGVNIATDFYYACLDGDWNANKNHLHAEGVKTGIINEGEDDAADLYYDMHVGRMPAQSVEEATTLIDKSMRYEGSESARFDATYQESISFYSEVLFWRNEGIGWNGQCDDMTFDGTRLVNTLVDSTFVPAAVASDMHSILEAHYCEENAHLAPIPENRAAVIDDFNSGRNWVVHIGHGARDNMAVGAPTEKLSIGDADAFSNGDRTSLLYAINCNSGAVDFDSLCEHFLKNPNGGAASVIAATDLDYPSTSQKHLYLMFKSLRDDPSLTMGELFYEPMLDAFLVVDADNESSRRWSLFVLILLGDPTLRPWSETPQELELSAGGLWTMGEPYAVSVGSGGSTEPLADVNVTVYKPGEYLETKVSDDSGQLSFDVLASSDGPIHVTVTKPGYRTQTFQVNSWSPFEPVLSASSILVDDTAAGNGDGRLDPGETADVAFEVSNVGRGAADDVSVSVSLDSPYVTLVGSGAAVGAIDAQSAAISGTVAMTAAIVVDELSHVSVPVSVTVSSPTTPDVTTDLVLSIGDPALEHVGLEVVEATGDADGVPEVGERIELYVDAYNSGFGASIDGSVTLTGNANVSVVTESVAFDASVGEVTSLGPLVFDVLVDGEAELTLTYADATGELFVREIDFDPPSAPSDPWSVSGTDDVRVNWLPSESSDVLGYNLYILRPDAGGVFEQVNEDPLRQAFGSALGLDPLTTYEFRVTAVDASGNEGEPSSTVLAATSPPNNPGFPVPLSGPSNRSSPTFVDLDFDGQHEIIFGSDYLYVIRSDGSEYIDGDGRPATVGVFSELGYDAESSNTFWGKPAVADLDLDGRPDIVAGHFTTAELYAWDGQTGGYKWGGLSHDLGDLLWSTPAIGNIDNDPELEVVIIGGDSNGPYEGAVCVFNHDGSEVFDGDDDPATRGVFWKSPTSAYNYGSVSLFDFDNDGRDEIVFAERADGEALHVLDFDPSGGVFELPGWPANVGNNGQFTSGPAVVDLVGDGNPADYGIFVVGDAALHGYDSAGNRLSGFPKNYPAATFGNFRDFLPSPMIGDISGDGQLDVIHGWEGRVYAYDISTGLTLPGWPITIDSGGQGYNSAMFNGAIGNLDDDPDREVLLGSGGGRIYAFNGDGTPVRGFPYTYGAEVSGAPVLWDVDQDGNSDLVMLGTQGRLTSLELTGVTMSTDSNVWPQFRHNARNTGVYGGGISTVPIELGSVQVVSSAPGRVDIRWDAHGDYLGFDIERSSPGDPRRHIGTVDRPDDRGRWGFVDTGAPAGFSNYWIVGRTSLATEVVGPFGVTVLGAPATTALYQNAPNPFAPRTSIRYDVGGVDAQIVRLEVFDVVGRRVATLVDGAKAPGSHAAEWDGRSSTGDRLANGIYLYRLSVGRDVETRKLTLRR